MTLVYIVFIFATASALLVAMRRIKTDKTRKAAREKELLAEHMILQDQEPIGSH